MSYFYSYLSHLIGHRSMMIPGLGMRIVALQNITASMCLNIVLAVGCIVYAVPFFMGLLSIPSSLAIVFSVMLLITALPFELLNSKTQNSDSVLVHEKWDRYPILSQTMMLVVSIMGAIQYLIRNFILVRNFVLTNAGKVFIQGMNRVYPITAGRFAMAGGMLGFCYHFLLSYSNWDKYADFNVRRDDMEWYSKMTWGLMIVWVAVQLSISMQALVMLGFIGWGAQFLRCPKSIKKAIIRLKTYWKANSHIFLPIGAFLYSLVDFNNSYLIVSQLGWLNGYTIGLCGVFGMMSFMNVSMIWGYNMVRFSYGGVGREVSAQSKLVKYFYYDPHIRRLCVYTKEGMLCGLDLLANRLLLVTFNQALILATGFSINLFLLDMCTVCFAVNKTVTNMFQSGIDKKEYLNDSSYKNTKAARFAKKVVKFIEEDIPSQLGIKVSVIKTK